MLKGLVLDYYYSNINTSGNMNFDQLCNSIKNYFEGVVYKQNILLKWNKLILKSVINKSESKPMEFLKKLINKLWYLQYGLDPEVCIDRFIYSKLINTCQKISVC